MFARVDISIRLIVEVNALTMDKHAEIARLAGEAVQVQNIKGIREHQTTMEIKPL